MTTSTKPAHRPKSRDLIMDAMERILNENGYDAATIDAVIEQSGVARGTFYYNFPSKNAVVHALARRAAQPMVTRAKERMAEDTPLAEVLSDLAQGIVNWNRLYPNLGRAVLSSAYDDKGLPIPPNPEDQQSFRGFLAQIFSRCQAKGEIRSDIDPMSLSLMFIGMLFQGLFMWFLRPETDLPLWAEQTVSLFLEGVKS
ncbi:TetR/AcrR family transcriptional regulator [Kiloniella laminariae]|uniref:TetR/AcrR family transcriptional regulator n=1 Tax=Kiloniella laminariae TaxID=454162 RepID=A0ABT4LMW3_9PROT|nr:TetR/AcrR family transcriptional regulator [Kiloniella laminariae]MCZ4282411.1 TetR/AcrR family transcriptional regulator [Kiloniella laminariae]